MAESDELRTERPALGRIACFCDLDYAVRLASRD
jgi:hypothetical protein